MNASIPTDDDLRDLMRRVVDATPPAPSFDEALVRAASHGVVAGPDYLVPADPTRSHARRRRSIGTFIAAILVALGLTGGGYLAYATFIGPDGYDSPTEAAEAFVDAASSGDLLRASRALAPFERDHMAERLEAVLASATEQGLLADNDLGDARNIRLEPSGLRWSEHEIAPNFTRVEVQAGTLELSFDGRLFGTTLDGGPGPQRADLVQELRPSDPSGTGRRPAGFVTVEVDGDWYVSLTYSVFETVRLSTGTVRPELGMPVTARGEATPEEAATRAVDGFYGGGTDDLDALLPVIDPVSGEAFHRYLPALMQDAGGGTSGLGMRSVDWSFTGDGDRRVAHLDSFDTPEYDDTTGEPTGRFTRIVTDDCAPADRAVRNCGLWDISVALVERDGRWYVDPIESLGRLVPSMVFGRASASESAARAARAARAEPRNRPRPPRSSWGPATDATYPTMRAPTGSMASTRWLPSGTTSATRPPSPARTKAATVGPEPLSHTASGSAATNASMAGRLAGAAARRTLGVEAVLGGSRQRGEVAGGERSDEERRPAHVEHGVGEGDLGRERGPGLLRRRLDLGPPDDDLQVRASTGTRIDRPPADTTNPPSIDAPALSGWRSRSHAMARASARAVASSTPASSRPARAPATRAAPENPRPRPGGIGLRHRRSCDVAA